MTKFSDWIVITGDRMCDLPPDTKVQVMWRDDNAHYAEKHGKVDDVCVYTFDNNVWYKEIFAYRIPLEPVYKTVEYDARVSEGVDGIAIITRYGFGGINESIPVKAKVTFVDGKLASGSWKVVE